MTIVIATKQPLLSATSTLIGSRTVHGTKDRLLSVYNNGVLAANIVVNGIGYTWAGSLANKGSYEFGGQVTLQNALMLGVSMLLVVELMIIF